MSAPVLPGYLVRNGNGANIRAYPRRCAIEIGKAYCLARADSDSERCSKARVPLIISLGDISNLGAASAVERSIERQPASVRQNTNYMYLDASQRILGTERASIEI